MSEIELLKSEIADLRREKQQLSESLQEAKQALHAFARGEVDAVAHPDSGSPVLLQEAQSQLRASRAMLEEAQAIAHVGSWASGFSRDDIIQWSPEARRILGVRNGGKMTVEGFFAVVHDDDRERLRQALRDAIAKRAPVEIEHRILFSGEDARWVHGRGVVEHDDKGQAVRLVGTIQDITERKRVEGALLRSEAELREKVAVLGMASHAARLGGWSFAPTDATVSWSDEVCAIHEVAPGTSPDLERALNFYAPEFRQTIRDKFGECIRDGTSFDLELQVITGKNRIIWVRAIGNAERNTKGEITQVRGALQDIDERRKLQDQFRQSQKMDAIGRLAGGVAHDFNNLLTVILSYAALSMDGLKPGDPLLEDLQEIRTAGHRATELTKQLLAFSRQQVLQPQVIHLNESIASMKSMLGRLLGEDVELSVRTAEGIGRILADPGQIEQVVMNLSINARDAMPLGGKLTIETSNVVVDEEYAATRVDLLPGNYVLLAISDSGSGMDASTRARIFEPFFTTKDKGKGTGLGLSTVFGIVQQSGGSVGVYSEVGVGTTFKVYFPRTDRAATVSTRPAPPKMLRGTETILLVEDEKQVRAVGSTILRRNGYYVLEASNGEEAVLIARGFKERIHLLLTDVVMPRMSGRLLSEQLAGERPEMKLLYASGYTDDAIVHHGVLDAGVAFLQKPFTAATLLSKVREVLDAVAKLDV